MIVVESGGTKSTWVFRDSSGNLEKTVIEGLHPQEINADKRASLTSFLSVQNLKGQKTYFFGAGCESDEGKRIISDLLESVGLVPVTIASDVVGACMAVLGNKPGVAGILGTGAVAAQYDGQKVVKMASGRGYILGDEGSGFDIGRRVSIACLDGKFSSQPELEKAIYDYYGGEDKIVHSCSAPGSRFKIAGLTRVIATFKDVSELRSIILAAFDQFIERGINLLQHNNQVSMVGSVAYHFQDELANVLNDKEIVLNTVIVEAAEEIYWFIEDNV
jgi:N-acetylglucosamine kinase-like BadF-type ATPase